VPLSVALLAVAFIAAMVMSGREPETRWLVRSDAVGVMSERPDNVRRVELAGDGRRLAFSRAADGGWATEGNSHPLPEPLASELGQSIRNMHVSPPIRVISSEEYRAVGLREFGLDPPRVTVTLRDGPRVVLEARFGAPNPQKVLQYMQVRGRGDVYLMSRFVGQAWEHVLEGRSGR
jgi:hypothetical protein